MKNNRFILTVIFVVYGFTNCYGQYPTEWYFGQNAGLAYEDGEFTPLNGGQINTLEGCASICDSLGNLLFYTDGSTVYNRKHDIMKNGTYLSGSESTSECLILPVPGNRHEYYLFTSPWAGDTRTTQALSYSIIDMDQLGGLGTVVDKNIELHSPTNEGMVIVPASEENTFWLISHLGNSSDFYAYKIGKEGISSPVISTTDWRYNPEICYMAYSEKINMLAVTIYEQNIIDHLYFDNASGALQQSKIVKSAEDWPYGICFSPSGKYYYVGMARMKELYQYESDPLIDSFIKISTVEGGILGALLHSPDSSSILVSSAENSYFGQILEPDSLGLKCNFEPKSIYLGGNSSLLGFPQYVVGNYIEITYTDSLRFPNVFSPNSDGINDFYRIMNTDYRRIEIEVYNRWGQIVYANQNYLNNWDGITFAGVAIPDGVYFYKASRVEDENQYSGSITLLR